MRAWIRKRPAGVRCGLLLGLLWLSGCKQGENERCQIDSDCGENLYCELGGNTRAMGGICKSTTAPSSDLSTATPADMATNPPPDMSVVMDQSNTDI